MDRWIDSPQNNTNNNQQKLVRALGFFYHLSLAVLFTTFTELLLGDFGGNFSKTAAFLG